MYSGDYRQFNRDGQNLNTTAPIAEDQWVKFEKFIGKAYELLDEPGASYLASTDEEASRILGPNKGRVISDAYLGLWRLFVWWWWNEHFWIVERNNEYFCLLATNVSVNECSSIPTDRSFSCLTYSTTLMSCKERGLFTCINLLYLKY